MQLPSLGFSLHCRQPEPVFNPLPAVKTNPHSEIRNPAIGTPDTQTALVIFTNGDHGQAAYSWVFRKLIGEAASLAWI